MRRTSPLLLFPVGLGHHFVYLSLLRGRHYTHSSRVCGCTPTLRLRYFWPAALCVFTFLRCKLSPIPLPMPKIPGHYQVQDRYIRNWNSIRNATFVLGELRDWGAVTVAGMTNSSQLQCQIGQVSVEYNQRYLLWVRRDLRAFFQQ